MAGENPAYADAVRMLPCRSCGQRYGVQAHHAGPRALARRAHDSTCVPLCYRCHGEWHAASGWAKLLNKQQRREWAELAIQETRDRVAPSLGYFLATTGPNEGRWIIATSVVVARRSGVPPKPGPVVDVEYERLDNDEW